MLVDALRAQHRRDARPTTNYEIVCVVDASTDPALLDELRAIAGDRLRVVAFDRPFNFSAKVNLGAVHSEGEHLLLLNDDMEVAHAGLDRADGHVLRACPAIGAVGAPPRSGEDGRLQHAGILFENGGYPGHLYRGFAGDFTGYSNNVLVAQNYLAVTGACMMTPRDVFERGRRHHAPTLPINYNDMDYCLKLRSAGACGSSTTRTRSSTTSSPRAAPPRSRTGRRSR